MSNKKEKQEEQSGCIFGLFNIAGYIGFALLIPVLLFYVGFEAPQQFLIDIAGDYGSLDFFVFLSFALLSLRILFGSSRLLLPTFLALLASAPLIFTTLQTQYFETLQQKLSEVSYLEHNSLNFITGIIILLIGVQLSNRTRVNPILQLILIVILPYAALIGINKLGYTPKNDATTFSLKEGYKTASEGTKKAIARIDEKYRKDPDVQEYIEEVVNNDQTEEDEKEKLIEALKQRIDKLENDKEKTEEVRKENQHFKEEIEQLNKQNPADSWCIGARKAESRSYGYDNAVQIAQPCVRDLAVHLASGQAGSYHQSGRRGVPTEIGLRQIAAIHTYVSDQWKYVNDPTTTDSDYFSTASRSISVGFAGDCDDFSIVMASLVGGVGGTARIMFGECENGGHAWAEVLIGSKTDWDNMQKTLSHFFSNQNRSFAGHSEDGSYWLSLDWRLGEMSCADRNVRSDWNQKK